MNTLLEEETLATSTSSTIDFSNVNKSSWKTIAKVEIKVRTHFVRNHRGLFFGILYGLLLTWAVILAPLMFSSIYGNIIIENIQSFKEIMGLFIETIMMTLFIILLIYPLNTVYRKTEIGFHETLLASPANAKDIFLGRFVGKWPFYGTAILIVTPLLIGLVGPIISLTAVDYAIIYTTVFGMIFLANLVGSVLASWIEKRIMRSEKARDLGKALVMVLSILMVVVMYSVIFFLNEMLANKELRNWLMFYPALWYSNIIQYAIDPILLEGYVLNIWMSSILAITIPILILCISYQRANNFYTLEGGIEKISSSAIVKENFFYKGIRTISSRKWGGLIVTQFKAFIRKKENFARVVYVVGLIGFFSWFYSLNMPVRDAEDLVVTQTILTIMAGLMYSLLIGSLIFVDSKDLIWVYKRSPRGVEALIWSYLLTMLVLDIFIGVFITILMSIFFSLDLVGSVVFFIFYLVYSMVAMVQSVGVNCFSPAYETKGGKLFANTQVTLIMQIASMFLMIFAIFGLIPSTASLWEVRLMVYVPLLMINIGLAIPVMYFGLKKLNNME